MADPGIPIGDDDLRFEDRDGSFALVDPRRGDRAVAWPAGGRSYRWRTCSAAPSIPYPCGDRDDALEGMLGIVIAEDTDGRARLDAQRSRNSFGMPQIVRARLPSTRSSS